MYVGPWLPEPLLTTPDVAEDIELAESVSMAMMLVLETLSPTERAVFVLREAFELGYDEIAAAIGKTPAAVRQIAHRARRHVDARRPHRTATPSEGEAVVKAFQHAVEASDLEELMQVLAPDVVAVSDGGGLKLNAMHPIVGVDKVIRMFLGSLQKIGGTLSTRPTQVNGSPALLFSFDGRLDGVVALRIEDRQVTGIYYVRNPEKLSRLERETALTLR